MDNIMDLLDPTKPIKKITMPRPSRRKRVANDMSILDKELGFNPSGKPSTESGIDYIKQYREKDDKEYLKLNRTIHYDKNDCEDNMSEVSVPTTEQNVRRTEDTSVYRTYNFRYRPKTTLPIHHIRNNIVTMIASNPVVVIRGSTGCGKTTQVPQFILDAEFENNRYCNIIVTQPRRIAALSIAKRVSNEREWPVGTLVGYQMGLIKNTCPDTRITYCTTGVLLNKLVNSKSMMEYTHVILDEVHERDEDMDFLLLVVKRLLRTNSTTVKVVLMSATIDVNKFATYFSTPMVDELVSAPVIDVEKGSLFDVSVYYIDEMSTLGSVPEVSINEPKLTKAMIEFCIRIIYIFDYIDKNSCDQNSSYSRSAVLIFLPGISEIEDLYDAFSSAKYADLKWDMVILHSLISTDDQEKVFKQPRKDYRRLILATNIAESSITVPDVKYVIDFCLTKLLVTDPRTNYQSLKLCWASKTNCQQRSGRAGRVMDGRVYRMVPRTFYNDTLCDEIAPEMLRAPLANIVLKAKLLDIGEPKAVLALALDPPDLKNLQNTILLLKEVGALIDRGDEVQEFDGDLTSLGRVMGSLPLSIYISKLIVLGHIFGVLQDAIIIGATMSVKDMFNLKFQQSSSTYFEKLNWAANSDSDCIACLNAFKVWRKHKVNRHIINNHSEKEWARRNNLRVKVLREINALVSDLTNKLQKIGIKETTTEHMWEDYRVNRIFIIKVIIAGAFYPNYFVRSTQSTELCKSGTATLLYNRNPMNTVYLQGWPVDQPGPLYNRQIQQIFIKHLRFANHKNIEISFDGSSRVYIEYNKNDEITHGYTFIQHCIHMKRSRIPIEVNLLSTHLAHQEAEKLGITNENSMFYNISSSATQVTSKQHPRNIQEILDKSELQFPLSDYKSSVILQGPYTPLEISLRHLVIAGTSKTVQIEAGSVNSVLLNTNPDNPSRPLLVAQCINQHSDNEGHLTLRNTTLLPNMPGLTALITLIFTPYMELRRSPLGTYYIGALCGLGSDYRTGESRFLEHDIEILFDVEITTDDLQAINKLRYWMNVAMHFSNDPNDDGLTIECQDKIKDTFTKVIYKKRKLQEPCMINNFDRWNRYDESLFLESAGQIPKNNIYSLHKALELNEKNHELEEMLKHLLHLEQLAYEELDRTNSNSIILCKLCSKEIYGIIELRVHLCTEEHKSNQQMLKLEDYQDIQNLVARLKI